MEITSFRNPRIKEIISLREKSRKRREEGLFIVEGKREICACMNSGFIIRSVYYVPDLMEESKEDLPGILSEKVRSSEMFSVSSEIYSRIACRETTEGILAVVHEKKMSLNDIMLRDPQSGNPLVLVLESVEKPGNLGAVLRTADACGVDAVLVCDPLTDLFNPNLIRASLGGIFTMQVVACSDEDALDWLHKKGISILTAQLQDSLWYYETDMIRPCAIVMGTESTGLSGFWRDVSDAKIKIPMLGHMDSLNVSVSAAVLCYEAIRQRNR